MPLCIGFVTLSANGDVSVKLPVHPVTSPSWPMLMSSSASSLAMPPPLSYQEPMRMSVASHLRTLLQTALVSAVPPLSLSAPELEQVLLLLTNDNLDLGCAVIEKAASEKVSTALLC